MSSYNIRNIREISNDPLTKFTNQLAKKLSHFLVGQELDKLENKEDIYSDGQDIDSVIKLHTYSSQKFFDGITEYYPTFEPDGDKLRLWIRGTNLGNYLKDWTEFDRNINLHGDPLLVDGTPFDLGINTYGIKSLALRFNRPTSDLENEEYINPDSDVEVLGLTTGISFFCRFRIFDLAGQGGYHRTLYQKKDDTSNALRISISDTGRVVFCVKRAGTEYRSQTATSTITTNTVYDLWCTYANSGNTLHIYVNNVDKSLTDPGTLPFSTLTDEAYIMRFDSDGGYTYGDLYDFRVYREMVVSAAQVGYMYTNKWTIANIAFGKCMITNYWATLLGSEATLPPTPSFTSTSFTSGSFDI